MGRAIECFVEHTTLNAVRRLQTQSQQFQHLPQVAFCGRFHDFIDTDRKERQYEQG